MAPRADRQQGRPVRVSSTLQECFPALAHGRKPPSVCQQGRFKFALAVCEAQQHCSVVGSQSHVQPCAGLVHVDFGSFVLLCFSSRMGVRLACTYMWQLCAAFNPQKASKTPGWTCLQLHLIAADAQHLLCRVADLACALLWSLEPLKNVLCDTGAALWWHGKRVHVCAELLPGRVLVHVQLSCAVLCLGQFINVRLWRCHRIETILRGTCPESRRLQLWMGGWAGHCPQESKLHKSSWLVQHCTGPQGRFRQRFTPPNNPIA